MITLAAPAHLGTIRSLWQQAFGDSAAYVNFFWGRHTNLENTLVCLEDNAVCGMLSILPGTLVLPNGRYPCAYLYGIATRQEARGQGIATRLLEAAHDLCAHRGYAVCALVPATSALFGFYTSRGYSTQGYVKTLSAQAAALAAGPSAAVFSAIDHHPVFALRQKAFCPAYLEWDSAALAYAQAEHCYLGGGFYRYALRGKCGYLSCVPRGDALSITEFSGSELLLPELLRGLHQIYHKQTYLVRLRPTATAGTLTPFAMTKWIATGAQTAFYLSFALD